MLGAAQATPGFWDWSFDPPLVLTVDLAILYWVGSRRTVTPARKRALQLRRDTCFYLSLAVLLIALSSPLEILSEKLFWAHMLQHVLLLVVAAPLFVLAAPWVRLWRCLPLSGRRWLARGFAQGERAAPLRSVSHFLGRPWPAFVIFSVVLLAWHAPPLFDATLRSSGLHALEHTLFFVTAVMFFKQVIPSPPLHITLEPPIRVLYTVGAMIVSWALAVAIALAPHPLYDVYAHEAVRPGGISALADQQIAAGVMWVPGSITFLLVVFAYVHRWLTPDPPVSRREAGLLA